MPKRDISGFIAHWSAASPSERANSQAFLLELCDLLEVPAPDNHPAHGYFFEYPVTEHHSDGSKSTGRIDLYKRECFVLESKQFQEAKAEASQLELAAEDAGVTAAKKSSQPVRGTEAWDDAMIKARGQAERYVRALPNDNPPFILVVDVGHTFEIFADFTQAGKAYLPFPDPRTFRIRLEQLRDEKIRERLRLIWTNPAALDPALQSADVTREISGHLAELAKSLEKSKHEPEVVAQFLTRCLFCMFAEDVGLLPDRSFTELLESIPANGDGFQEVMQQLFREMNTGTGKGISVVLRKKLLHFNGGLFADDTVLPLNGLQFGLLKKAAQQNWAKVEPAIFGTLLERALNPAERHQLGAHYTPRAYVERLVLPTVVEPLRAEWENIRAAAVTHARAGNLKKARTEVNAYHDKLCQVTVLDPACGSGNFLYVALEHLKRLEGEVLDVAASFGESFKLELQHHTVDPHQFLGIEINPRAAAIAELVLWIGYLQWHFRTRGATMPEEPVLKKFKNIECRDAVLDYDGEPQPVTWAMAAANPDLPGLPDEVRNEVRQQGRAGSPLPAAGGASVTASRLVSSLAPPTTAITVWDRRSMKTDLVTGREVPDETKRVPLLTYKNPRPALWPRTDFIVGNPPFIGTARMREDLGDGYAETLRATYPEVPESADFVLYWWHKAAELTRAGRAQRFGFITTNSLRQTFARRVVQFHLSPVAAVYDRRSADGSEDKVRRSQTAATNQKLSLVFAIPDHPWVDMAEGAAVRIAMTVGAMGDLSGELLQVTAEEPQPDGSEKVSFSSQRGKIQADLTCGAAVNAAKELAANSQMSCEGVKLHGMGFVVTRDEAKSLGLGRVPGLDKHVRPYVNGRDLADESRDVMAIDLFGLSIEEVRTKFPSVYQHVLNTVKPERDANNRATYRDNWWIFGEPRREFRPAIAGLNRYIATIKTAKHRVFQFLDASIIPDSKLIAFPSDDAYLHGVLSSRIHCHWALVAGSWLGFGNDPTYVKSASFEKFPFPLCSEADKERIRKLAEELDAHRKRVQAQHGLTLTGLYNVLEKLRAGAKLTDKDKLIHEKGLVSVLHQLHEDLDAAVFAAYGWQDLWEHRQEAHKGSVYDFKTGVTSQLDVASAEAFGKIIAAFEKELDAEILTRLVTLNAERAAEEKRGIIHWLRPEYQTRNQKAEGRKQKELSLPEGKAKPKAKAKARADARPTGRKTEWPKSLAERVKAVETALHASGAPTTSAELAKQFKRAKPADVAEILETLVTVGRAHRKGNQFTR